ncbi:MAG: kelch repeat-containing protein [Planctomycetaceae bacterium]
MNRLTSLFALVVAVFWFPTFAQAHFLWLVTEANSQPALVHLYFAEAAEADDPDLLKRVKNPQIVLLEKNGKLTRLKSAQGDESIVAKLPQKIKRPSAVLLNHRYGVISRGKSTFLLKYYAKSYLASPKQWGDLKTSKSLALDISPSWDNGRLRLHVAWQQKPAEKIQVKIEGPGIEDAIEGETNAKGEFFTSLKKPGLFSIRVRYVEPKKGELGGKTYDSVRHYSTLAVRIPGKGLVTRSTASEKTSRLYPDFPKPVTSFGGAISNGYLYTYGGHLGKAHSYSISGQSNVLRRLNLKKPSKWEFVTTGPRMQGLAMVAYNGKLYRIGGFTAKNKAGEERDLWSRADVSCFDPKTRTWSPLPSLPQPRSSHDAAIIGSKVYVVGGWKLQGDDETQWHQTAWVMDLNAKKPSWTVLPKPPFKRRALAVAAYQGKLYVIGGMQAQGGPSTRVDIYNPKTQTWTQGPNLQGKPFEGFGCSAFAAAGRLYVSTNQGNLQQLSKDGKSWKIVRKLERPRFFHRMLPFGQDRLILVGGASMSIGKFPEVDVIHVK